LHQKFITTGNLGNASHQGRRRPRRSDENIEAVQASIERLPTKSSHHRSSQLGISRTSLRRIIRDDLKLFPYKIQVTLRFLPIDKPRLLDYANFVVNVAQTDDDFWQKIIMSNEAHFSLNGTVNKQNCRFYANENSQLIQEEPLHDQRVTVWAGICAERIIGPFFFEDDAGAAVTVTGERYRAMITNFFMPILTDKNMDNFWFQQDGATAHIATIALLRPLFFDRLISKNGDFDWPPRSPDLTPPDFFLWGPLFEVQSLCQQTDPGSLERQYPTGNSRYSARNNSQSDGKCQTTSPLRHSFWRRPFTRYHIQKVTRTKVQSSK